MSLKEKVCLAIALVAAVLWIYLAGVRHALQHCDSARPRPHPRPRPVPARIRA
jgi:hypothetical protein